MTRRTWLLISVLTIGCGGGNQDGSFNPPPTVIGAGALDGFESVPADGAPENIRSMGVERAYVAHYSGERSVVVSFYHMKSGASAFELVQKWRPADGKLAIYSGAWFVVIESPGTDNAALSAMANELEAVLAR
jgi:hypothetical protein